MEEEQDAESNSDDLAKGLREALNKAVNTQPFANEALLKAALIDINTLSPKLQKCAARAKM